MANKPRWKEDRGDGVLTIKIRRWLHFPTCLSKYVIANTEYIYRGQADASWLLEPTLSRELRMSRTRHTQQIEERHLSEFRLAARGRRGPHPTTYADENEWWALGQHHGLASPLLDWTRSPYVAAYFAFAPAQTSTGRERCIFGLQAEAVREYCDGRCELKGVPHVLAPPGGKPLAGEERIATFVPLSDENSRLVSQNGLFTRGPRGIDYEAWVRRHFHGLDKGMLVKFILPTSERTACLQGLNRMNINHLTLFPDVYGAARHCNHLLQIPRY